MFGKIVGGAAKFARQKLKADNLTSWEREDILAAAALGFVKGQQKSADDNYRFAAAKNEAMKFIMSQVFQKGITESFHDYENYESEPEHISEFGQSLNEDDLADMFLKYREKKGRRGHEASRRDARICKLLLQGYGNAGIAQELDMPETHIRRYRADIKRRLMKIANNL